MTGWRTDFENLPEEFDVIVRNHKGDRWREIDCILNESGQICSSDHDWGYEPIEYSYPNGEFRRITHWAPIELPPLENKGRPG